MTQKNKSNTLSNRFAPVVVFTTMIVLILLAVLLATALFSYHPTDPAWSYSNEGPTQNRLGFIGAWYSDLSFSLIGKLSFLLPLALLAFSVHAWFEKGIDKELLSWRLFMLLTAILSGCVLWAAHDVTPINSMAPTGGGYLGGWLFEGLKISIKSEPIIMAFSLTIFVLSVSLLLNFPWLAVMEWIGRGISRFFGTLFAGFAAREKKKDNAHTMKSYSEEQDADLQNKINAINQLAEKDKSETPVKPTFTIDRYEGEDDDMASDAFIPQIVQTAEQPTVQPAVQPTLQSQPTQQSATQTQATASDELPRNEAGEIDLSAFGLSHRRPSKKQQTAAQQSFVQPAPATTSPNVETALVDEQPSQSTLAQPAPQTPQWEPLKRGSDEDYRAIFDNPDNPQIAVQSAQTPDTVVEPTHVVGDEIPISATPQLETDDNVGSEASGKAEPSFFDFDRMKPGVKVNVAKTQRPTLMQEQEANRTQSALDLAAQINATQPAQPQPVQTEAVVATAEPHVEQPQIQAQVQPQVQQPHVAPTAVPQTPQTPPVQTAQPVVQSAPQPTLAPQAPQQPTETAPVAPIAPVASASVAQSPQAVQAEVQPSTEPLSEIPMSLADTFSEPMVRHPEAAPQAAPHVAPQAAPHVDTDIAPALSAVAPSEPISPTPTVAPPPQSSATIGKAYNSEQDAQEPAQPIADKPHELPGIHLLDNPPPQQDAYTEDMLAEMALVLETTLKQFNVQATVMHVSPGPVITRFEIDLAPGIQAKKITNLSQDLARALAVSRVRVEEVIAGSSYVGLEVPNQARQIVYFKDVVRSKAFQNSQSPLTISLGSDTSGKPVVADLMKMPHALVAGTTGSGKSVCINVMLLSMLYKASPKDLRLILVDPKMLEMSMYEDIPHLLTPVITDMNEAENALTWAVGEMERRYQLMAALKVRKIDAFNETVDTANARGEPIKDPLWQPDENVGYTHHPNLERLPFIVIVIDELADMMMVVGKQVEQLIARLTQKARAAGIHVVLATQRPSTDVLTGLIKANVPTRIAFQVSSGTDSRVIIDGVGAEKLLGHGDMLYVPPGASHPQRLHGAFVGDAETDRITHYLRSTGEPDYIDGITHKQDPETLGAFGAAEAAETKEDADPLYAEAVQIVLQTGKASISSVQRQLRIGYNRAARMIEDMQEQGIVSEPVNGVRKVLAAPPPKTDV